jgi:hypothetical protein
MLGSKVTVKLAHFAGKMVTGTVPATTNCETEDVTPVTVMFVLPMLYTVKTWVPLIVPNFCGLKFSPVGRTEAAVPANEGMAAITIPQTANTRRQILDTDSPCTWRIDRLLKMTPRFGGESS